VNLKIATRRAMTLAWKLTAPSQTADAVRDRFRDLLGLGQLQLGLVRALAEVHEGSPRSRRPRYHPSAAGLSFHTAAMVMPTAVLPYETRARCAVNDFLDSEPAVSVRNVH
jgi:hypothetical protein